MLEMENIYYFLFLLPIVAFLYSSVGHGGASGYLALMALFSIAPGHMKSTALLLNLFVSGVSFYHFYKGGYFKAKMFLYFAISSIPMAFLGGRIEVDENIYKKILGLVLIFAIMRLLGFMGKEKSEIVEVKLYQGIIVGAIIGLLSGLIGIGGGIILSPVILILSWGNMKEAAAVSSLFIWVNSAAGLLGQFSVGVQIQGYAIMWVILALAGGYLGAYYGSSRFDNRNLKYILALVLMVASAKLLIV